MSSANSGASLFLKTAYHIFTRPADLAVYGVTWYHLYSLCQFGRISRNMPVLLCCLFWWVCAFCYGLWLWTGYNRHKILSVFRAFTADGNMLAVTGAESGWNQAEADGTGTGMQTVRTFAGEHVKWYIRRKKYCQIFLRDKTVIVLDLRQIPPEETDFLDLKLSMVPAFRKKAYRTAAGFLLAAVTLSGSFLVVRSAIPYQGKLSWYLRDLQDKKSTALRHDNIYETGIEGILEDIRRKVELPETLCLATSFNLHFAPDGTIRSFDTMLYGYDKEGNYVDSYLISYPAGVSREIAIYLHGAAGVPYDADKDLEPLIEAVSVMPLAETAARWEGESSFGILYYGTREWYSQEGILYLNYAGEYRTPLSDERYFSGYSVSVFCPENEALTPVRYLYVGYQVFPEEQAAYTADYYPEEEKEEEAGYPGTGSTMDADQQKVHATDNFWRTCSAYPAEQYGETAETENLFQDRNGEDIYRYHYRNFLLDETWCGAEKVNLFLQEKEQEIVEDWQRNGEQSAMYATAGENYEYGRYPHDSMEFRALTYLEEDYCSLVFFGEHYSGGVSAFPAVYAYTIDVRTGEETGLEQIAPQIKEEDWIALIDRAFEKEQGFYKFFEGSTYEETAGESWLRSEREGGWASGFYLTEQGIVIYYDFGQIAWDGYGAIEVLVPWEDVNG